MFQNNRLITARIITLPHLQRVQKCLRIDFEEKWLCATLFLHLALAFAIQFSKFLEKLR